MLFSFIQSTFGTGINVVAMPTNDLSNLGDPIDGTIYSGIRFGLDGLLYRRTATGNTWQSFGAWLLIGSASTFYLSRTINDGSLNTDSGTVQQMNANLDYDVQEIQPASTSTAEITFNIYDNNTETTQNNFPVSQSYSLSAFMRTP